MNTQEALESRIFTGASLKGYVKKNSPEDITLRDEGQFPQTPDTLKMLYDFGKFKLHVGSDKYENVSISTTDLFIKHMWDQKVREVYASIKDSLDDVITKVKEDPEYLAFNDRVMSQKPIDSQWFRTNIAYPDFIGAVDEAKVEDYLDSIPAVKTNGELEIHDALEMYLENGIKVIAVKTVLGCDLNFVADERHSQEQLESVIRNFDPESKGWHNDPSNENTKGTDFRFGFNPGYFRLPFLLFEEDVKQLEVIPFGKETPYI